MTIRQGNNNRDNTGAEVEKLAARWLSLQGLRLIENNYSCRVGEIDLIMLDDLQLVFVEVRYRRQSAYGDGLESVDRRKQLKLQKAAAHFLMKRPRYAQYSCRFDVLAAKPDAQHGKLHWQWIKDAFTG